MEPRQEKFANLKIVYVPYWRFKGLEFTLGNKTPSFKVIDLSYLAVNKISIPRSLGLRSQTQKLKFLHKDIKGSFLPPAISRQEILQQISGKGNTKVHIGEILSLIFMPFFQDKDKIYDGLTGNLIPIHSTNKASKLAATKKSPNYNLKFTPSICPNCGWDLKGETDSLVLHCNNCVSFWLIRNKRLNRIEAMFLKAKSDIPMQMPFWRLHIEFATLKCSTRAHLIKLTNIPTIIKKEDTQQVLYFYIPAFKLNPKLFLRIGKQTTLSMIEPSTARNIPKGLFHPVDLPLKEGLQAVCPLLMHLCTNKNDTWDILKKEDLKLKSSCLIYLPFHASSSEYVQDTLGFSLQKNSLKFGRQL
jgi:hypothetical protein